MGLGKSRIIAFVPTRNERRAREFYQTVLGLEFISEDEFAAVFNVNGTMLRISKVMHFEPAPFSVLGWEVDDIRATLAELRMRGVTFERYEMHQDELGIWTAPGGAQVAWFKDPDGNVLSVTQMPK